MRVRFSATASTDLQAAVDWYLDQGAPVAADNLTREVRAVTAIIGELPGAGGLVGSGCRAIALKRFPFSLVYRVAEPFVEVLAFSHQSRRPGWWDVRSRG